MKLALFLIAMLAPAAFAQTDLPTIGTLEAIKGKSKFYVVANQEDREQIIKTLGKRKDLAATGLPEEAEFFIEYRELKRDSFGMVGTIATGQMDIYVNRDGKKLIAWSGTATEGAFKSAVPKELAGKFLKALIKGEKQ
jgi:hypothetical protein